ncbi:MAG: T9SS type A sorting domain-containing protein [Lewinellaceae bacterium]|nr:T9SS type A sorting domain-containing protein [Lewinellaceae bacterium]
MGNVYSIGNFNGTVDFDPGAGTFNLSATSGSDIYISKLDNAGNFIWAKALNGTGNNLNSGYSISLDPATGDVYTTGWFKGTVDFDPGAGVFNLSSNIENGFILKLDNAGNFLWAKSIKSASATRSFSIVIDDAGTVYSVGGFEGTADFDPGSGIYNLTAIDGADIYISKLDASGNYISVLTVGGTGFEYAIDLKLDPANGDIYIAGSFDGTVDFDPGVGTFNLTSNSTGFLEWDSYIFKLNSSGDFKWAKSVGGSGIDRMSYLALDVESGKKGVYATGTFAGTVDFDPGTAVNNLTSAGNLDAYLLKLDIDSGDLIWAKSFGGTGEDANSTMALDNSGDLYLTGYFYSPTLSFETTNGTTTFSNNPGSSPDAFIVKLDNMISSGVENIVPASGILIYPNPANDVLVVSFPVMTGKEVRVNITDLSGKIVYTATPTQTESFEINTANLAEGVYFINIHATDLFETKKMIISR